MILTGNTIFITGGGSGIGRGLAEALHKRGNLVIISGRRRSHLEATTKANPGMVSVELDLQDSKSIASVAKKLITQYPKLNVLINNAGIMQVDDAAGVIDDALLVSTVNDQSTRDHPSDLGSHRTPEEATVGNDHLQHFGARVCSAGYHRCVLIDEGGVAFLRSFATLQT